MRRKIEEFLINWKNMPRHKPLLLQGARQVGKTYIVRKFGAEHFDNTLYFNFEADPILGGLFVPGLRPEKLIPLLEIKAGQTVGPDSLIIFDEVQAEERALTSLKYFAESPQTYHVIATGSMLGIYMNRAKFSFPVGKVEMAQLYPLDFEEFLWARDQEALAQQIRKAFNAMSFFPLHEEALAAYKLYLLVGGMPEVVSTYAAQEKLDEVHKLQTNIVNAYIADMQKYASAEDAHKIHAICRSIPAQLAKANRKFQYSLVKPGGRSKEFAYPLQWLNMAGTVNLLSKVNEGMLPLAAHEDPAFFKLYMADVGLFASLLNLPLAQVLVDDSILGSFRGAIAESYVLQNLVAQGIKAYYWNPNQNAELDFVYQDVQGQIIGVEVKAGTGKSFKSLHRFLDSYDAQGLIISQKNFGQEGRIKTIPLYACHCLGTSGGQ